MGDLISLRTAKVLISAMAVALYFIVAANLAYAIDIPGITLILAGPTVIALYWPSVLIHELGHAAAALITRRRVHMVAVGRIGFSPSQRRFLHAPDIALGDHGGFVFATPKRGWESTRGDITFAVSGSLANFMFAAGLIFFATPFAESNRDFFIVMLTAAEVSIFVGAANLIPRREANQNRSDGAAIFDALRRNSMPTSAVAFARLYGWRCDGFPTTTARVEELAADFHSLSEEEDGQSLLRAFAFMNADFDSVIALHECKSHPNEIHPKIETSSYAFALALTGRVTDAVEQLDKIMDSERDFGYWRGRASVSHLLNRREHALEAVLAAKRLSRGDADDAALFKAIRRNSPLPSYVPEVRLFVSNGRVVGMLEPLAL
jgi:hypothetical protein